MADGTATQTGVAPSSEKAGTPQVFTRDDVDKAVRDAKSAALADVGRFQKEAANAMKAAQAAEGRVKQMLQEQDKRELDEARDDPAQLTALQERQKRRQIESELAEARQELTQKSEQLTQAEARRTEIERERLVNEVSTRFKVDAGRLAKMAKFTEGTPEAIEDLAKELVGNDGKSGLKPDSNRAIGGALGREQIIANYTKDPRNLANKERYFELRRSEGR